MNYHEKELRKVELRGKALKEYLQNHLNELSIDDIYALAEMGRDYESSIEYHKREIASPTDINDPFDELKCESKSIDKEIVKV